MCFVRGVFSVSLNSLRISSDSSVLAFKHKFHLLESVFSTGTKSCHYLTGNTKYRAASSLLHSRHMTSHFQLKLLAFDERQTLVKKGKLMCIMLSAFTSHFSFLFLLYINCTEYFVLVWARCLYIDWVRCITFLKKKHLSSHFGFFSPHKYQEIFNIIWRSEQQILYIVF